MSVDSKVHLFYCILAYNINVTIDGHLYIYNTIQSNELINRTTSIYIVWRIKLTLRSMSREFFR